MGEKKIKKSSSGNADAHKAKMAAGSGKDPRPMPKITVPVLQFHGLDDTALIADGLNDTWKYLDNTWTLVTVPGAGHWVHHDKPELVTQTMLDWMKR